ncbi:DUF2155 domain-containing protein [Ruegeria sp. 2205SS24-7]|uniref:DUF2155 domain-containing protein n=1 Tax=Ruegeria discodermiae TaxID=3064389 RepID=UPI002740F1DF|nr:DUF2155 domain-containing protein [Ruegeria sp. 2205SS24-7]MDP5220293.1 DUF2155 domain-containing protein [Ruegeria sp. 2205SS24-7]
MIRAAIFALVLMTQGAMAQDAVTSGTGGVVRGLDKVNGQTVDVDIRNGETGQIFGLDVALGDCRFPVDNPTGDAFAYLTIWETGKAEALFDGWMIASSPALNALDHARYDVWVIRCMTP